MISLKNLGCIGLCLFASFTYGQKKQKLKPIKWVSVAIPEPSDIFYSSFTNSFFIVSDNGILFETNKDGKVLRKVIEKNTDFEAVYANETTVFAIDETNRNIYQYDVKTFEKKLVTNVPYGGAKNKGYEGFTFNKSKNSYAIVVERDPIHLFELDANFKVTKDIDLNDIAKDISSATYYNNALWLLSDEDMQLLKLNPNTYEVLQRWSIPIINPEGLTFDAEGNLYITSDDMQRLYYFTNPEKN